MRRVPLADDYSASLYGAQISKAVSMNTNEAMREIVRQAGISQREASERMGRSPNWLGATLARSGSSEASTIAELAAACGWTLALVPSGELPEGAVAIDPPERKQPRTDLAVD